MAATFGNSSGYHVAPGKITLAIQLDLTPPTSTLTRSLISMGLLKKFTLPDVADFLTQSERSLQRRRAQEAAARCGLPGSRSEPGFLSTIEAELRHTMRNLHLHLWSKRIFALHRAPADQLRAEGTSSTLNKVLLMNPRPTDLSAVPGNGSGYAQHNTDIIIGLRYQLLL